MRVLLGAEGDGVTRRGIPDGITPADIEQAIKDFAAGAPHGFRLSTKFDVLHKGHRLRAAGVSREDRKALLGHAVGDVTTHYSAPDIARLIEQVEIICDRRGATVLRIVGQNSGKNSGKMRGLAQRV